MQSLPHQSHFAPVAWTPSNQLQQRRVSQEPDQRHQDWSNRRPQSSIRKTANAILWQLLLGTGLSLVGHGAIAEPVSGIPIPINPAQSVTLPQPHPISQSAGDAIAQQDSESVEEVIQGDSEARRPSTGKGSIYAPIRLQSGKSVEDVLTTKDIPMGQGSFARDYIVTLKAKDQVAIDLFSDSFDTVVTLMSENGTTLGENDDGPDGGTNSLLFMRITEDGDYVVRVRGFGQAKGGPFKLKLTRLKAEQ